MDVGGRDGGDARAAWESPYPYQLYLVDPNSDADWAELFAELARGSEEAPDNRPLRRVLEVARENQARSVVVETRYIDLDYRSEFSAFYSKAFQTYHDSCRRLHFFAKGMSDEDVLSLTQGHADSYLGYAVLRPQVRAVVGRTMLQAPSSLAHAVRTAVRERVTFFGQPLSVRAVPFMQQDARLGRCAHVAIWMCHYSAVRGEQRVARLPVAQFSLTTDHSLGIGRMVPSKGLTLHQMSDVLTRSGLPSIYYDVADLTDLDRPAGDNWLHRRNDPADRAARVACRYGNSGVPIIAVMRHASSGEEGEEPFFEGAPLHSVVICGYHRVGDTVHLIGHDDRRGPYMEYANLLDDFDPEWKEHARIEQFLAPVPDKVWLSGEAAERAGCEYLVEHARDSVSKGVQEATVLLERFEAGRLGFRAYAINSNRFKTRIVENIPDPVVIQAYRSARLPHYVWVVEAIDRDLREADQDSVLAEVVYDATSDDRSPVWLASRIPGLVAVARPDDPLWNQRNSFTSAIASAGQNRP